MKTIHYMLPEEAVGMFILFLKKTGLNYLRVAIYMNFREEEE